MAHSTPYHHDGEGHTAGLRAQHQQQTAGAHSSSHLLQPQYVGRGGGGGGISAHSGVNTGGGGSGAPSPLWVPNPRNAVSLNDKSELYGKSSATSLGSSNGSPGPHASPLGANGLGVRGVEGGGGAGGSSNNNSGGGIDTVGAVSVGTNFPEGSLSMFDEEDEDFQDPANDSGNVSEYEDSSSSEGGYESLSYTKSPPLSALASRSKDWLDELDRGEESSGGLGVRGRARGGSSPASPRVTRRKGEYHGHHPTGRDGEGKRRSTSGDVTPTRDRNSQHPSSRSPVSPLYAKQMSLQSSGGTRRGGGASGSAKKSSKDEMGSPELHTLASWSTTDMYTRCVLFWSFPCLSHTFLCASMEIFCVNAHRDHL